MSDALQSDLATRERLLAAAEAILLTQGFQALSTRAITTMAQTNISQIRYYFGGLDGLLEALLTAELDAVSRAHHAFDPAAAAGDVGQVVDLLLGAMRTPALFTPDGFASLAVEELYRQVPRLIRERAAEQMRGAHQPFVAALADGLPDMPESAVRYRFSAVMTMAMSLLPPAAGSRLVAIDCPGPSADSAWENGELKSLCVGALLAGDERRGQGSQGAS